MNRFGRWFYRKEDLNRYSDEEVKDLAGYSNLLIIVGMLAIVELVVFVDKILVMVGIVSGTAISEEKLVLMFALLVIVFQIIFTLMVNTKIKMMDRELQGKVSDKMNV